MSVQQNIDERDQRYLRLISARHRQVDDVKTANQLGFTSPVELYRQISYDGHPICPECGQTYVPPNHCVSFKGRDRNAKSFGESVKLPPAENAAGLFKHALDHLYKELDTLRGREDFLQSKRFVGTRSVEGKRIALGAWQSPAEPLTMLIAVYALLEGSAYTVGTSWLLGQLHPSEQWEVFESTKKGRLKKKVPNPNEVDMQRLDQAIKDLRLAGAHVAQIAYGKRVGPGPSTVVVSPRHQAAAPFVQDLHGQGMTAEQIAEEVNRLYRFGLVEEPFTEEEVRQIAERVSLPPTE
jgi:hypothetical protein